MTKISIVDNTGGAVGTADLPSEIFDVKVNMPLIHQVVVGQLAAARQGTHAVKSRGQVAGGGRKPYRQKGTGRARQGSIRAPQFAGGGVVHGPVPRDYSQRTPKKMKAAALRGALSDRARHGRVHVVSSLVDGDAPSTKGGLAALRTITERTNVLVVLTRDDDVTTKSLRNVPDVHVITDDQLNTYDVLCADDVVFTQDALRGFLAGKGLEAEFTDAKPAKKTAAKKAPAKKTAAEDAPAKKTAAKKTTAKKTTAKKTAAKKAQAPVDDAAAGNKEGDE